ncbi:FAS1-like dehydratase domain-containing protein [Rhizobium sp. C4]|uniref:FAS1-like dehydratase domain-containing protein n=1 Tax=Rhizobium sp. C4 TaxID=1349800 RepID=UPI001E2E2779|nr:MaoC family dehydratase N-terminal domain-containing protein [Rhizobium sp. C4]MCD2172209.1 MaoC family dehydratase N-terminal domain-containing protein [Rhizobium sp. C4]
MSEDDSTLDEAFLRTWIGREQVIEDTISADLANRFAATFDLNEDFSFGDIVPPLLHVCLAQPIAPSRQIGADGHPRRGDFLPPVPLPRRMWAAGSMRFTGDLHVGETVRRVSRIADLTIKEGRSGTLCFVAVDHQIEARGRAIVTERQDIVYRSAETGTAPPKAAQPAAEGAYRETFDPSPVVLFRYSAVTFNGHRIHYDKPYATDVEGYPGLVVHGPLQATLLMHFAAKIRGGRPAQFSFRSQSPLFGDGPIVLHAEEAGDTLKLWTAAEGGPVAMSAEAGWA